MKRYAFKVECRSSYNKKESISRSKEGLHMHSKSTIFGDKAFNRQQTDSETVVCGLQELYSIIVLLKY